MLEIMPGEGEDNIHLTVIRGGISMPGPGTVEHYYTECGRLVVVTSL